MNSRLLIAFSLLIVPASAAAQQQAVPVADSAVLTVRRIYGSSEFSAESFGPTRWLEQGAAFTTLERAAGGKGRDIVRYDTERGNKAVMVAASSLVPAGDTMPLAIEDYAWSPDGNLLLVFTNSKPVWRTNSRGALKFLARRSRLTADSNDRAGRSDDFPGLWGNL